jgi:outer membrane cobalamin receptor
MKDDENRSTIVSLDKQRMKSISHFRQTFEQLVDRILNLRLTSAPIYSSQSVGGIFNHVNNNGTTIPYGQMVQSIQSLQSQIKQLTNDANN